MSIPLVTVTTLSVQDTSTSRKAFHSMSKYFFIAIALLNMFAVFSSSALAQSSAVDGQYIIKFKSNTKHTSRARAYSGLRLTAKQLLPAAKAQLVEVNQGDTIDANYAKELLASGVVEYIEPNYIYTIDATPNDIDYEALWGMHNTGQTGGTNNIDIDAPEAWDIVTGNNEIVVGVVDTGVNYNHPDLESNIWVNSSEIPGNGIDDDENGVIDDVFGFNAIDGSGDPMDDHGHGSHCSGTIGATGNNTEGVAGVNWNVKVMGLKFLNSSGAGTTSAAIAAIEYAIDMKRRGQANIRVLSNSWGGGGYSQALEDAIESAKQEGILFIAAAGNAANDNDISPSYPASYDVSSVVSVAAIDHDGNLASFSNYGFQSVDIAAPGVNILSTVLGSDYSHFSGTSMATPHVSGVAALLLAHVPSLSVADAKQRLLTTMRPLSSLTNLIAVAGMINALNALNDTRTPIAPPPAAPRYEKASVEFSYDEELGTKITEADDAYVVANLGFDFSYYGKTFSQIVISANGRVIPGDTVPNFPDYLNKLESGINIYHTDLCPASSSQVGSSIGGVWLKTEESLATITWISVDYVNRNSSDPRVSVIFQMKLHAGGKIEFNYPDTEAADASLDYGASASVGLVPPRASGGTGITVSHNTSNELETGTGKSIRFNIMSNKGKFDFDGDGISDLAVWRPSTGMWFVLTSSSDFNADEAIVTQFGLNGDIPVPGDYDGDGRTDTAIWRPTEGNWYILNSNNSDMSVVQWGLPGDAPIQGDFDGDGQMDLGVYRNSVGAVYGLLSQSGFDRSGALSGESESTMQLSMGGTGYDTVVGDFNGDRRDDITTIEQVSRFWTAADYEGNVLFSSPWGAAGDTPITCDYDADNATDRVMVRVKSDFTLDWYTATASGLVFVNNFGSLGDTPSCDKDFDGDGRGDMVVFREATGEWFMRLSSTGEVKTYQWGLPGDVAF